MLQMIFQNIDLMDDFYYHNDYHDDYQNHYLYHSYNQKQKVIKKNMNDVCVNAKNEQDEEWGFYVEIDPPTTPPKHVFPKQNNNHKHLAINPIPSPSPTPTPKLIPNQICNEYSSQKKNVNYLLQIQEEEDGSNEQFILDIDIDLPQIQEEEDGSNEQFILDMALPPYYSNDKTYNDHKEKITQNIFSGLTICALTTASIYFYSKIRTS
jgi:hypothetical protein